jgi:hypothetical protein
MSPNLPYVLSPPSIKNALERIRTAAAPPKFTTDFVTTILQIKGGTGAAIAPFMKRLGFVASDGTPTELYKRFRNPHNGALALGEAIKNSYKELGAANEYFYKLSDKELQALVLQVTGLNAENRVAQAILGTLKTMRPFANFDTSAENQQIATASATPIPSQEPSRQPMHEVTGGAGMGLNLAYTINLNLPATSDQAVFNAIFKSLREHLLSDQ